MKQRKVLNIEVEWDKANVQITKKGIKIELDSNETVGFFIVLQEILKEWKNENNS